MEIQATAEQKPFDDQQMNRMMELGRHGVELLIAKQQRVLSNLMRLQ